MKTNIKNTLFLLFTLLIFASCKQDYFYDVQKNPNAKVSDPSLVVPAIPGNPISIPLYEEKIETFTQDSSKTGAVDILWVVDNSGSMKDNQDSLALNFNHFIGQFLDENIDFKMAITSTDAGDSHNGKMIGDSTKLTSIAANANRAEFSNNFTKWIKVGTDGSGNERGLKTASSFLSLYSSSYLRKDAYLAIVFLSDEEDHSDKLVSEYINQFQSMKTNKGMVKAYSIVTQVKPKNSGDESVGLRYNEVAKATGGLLSDITEDFSVTLKDIGGSIVKLIDSFPLAKGPYGDEVTVFVNGVQVTNGWVFDNVSHSIKFNDNAIPPEKAKIEIHYKIKLN